MDVGPVISLTGIYGDEDDENEDVAAPINAAGRAHFEEQYEDQTVHLCDMPLHVRQFGFHPTVSVDTCCASSCIHHC